MSDILLGVAAVSFLFWMIASSRREGPGEQSASAVPAEPAETASRVGTLAGLQGGDITDAVVAKHALNRAGSDGNVRDVATAVTMQRGYRPDSTV
ncbi:MAG: hypothetical protein ACK5Q5_09885 [Planctomycetaceae bacterium]